MSAGKGGQCIFIGAPARGEVGDDQYYMILTWKPSSFNLVSTVWLQNAVFAWPGLMVIITVPW